MKSFKDNQGQLWHLNLSLGKTRQLRDKLGLDLLNPEHYGRLVGSLTEQMAFCFLLVEPQAQELGIDVDAFEERLYGDGIANSAGIALLEECEVFFQKLGQKTQAALAKKSTELVKASIANMDQMLASGQLDSLMAKAEEDVRKKLQASGGSGLPSSQPSPA
jgi:hypothetical protein